MVKIGAALSVLVLGSAPALAAPQASLGVTGGVALKNADAPSPPSWGLELGGRADVLFLRERNGQMAVGPYLDLDTESLRRVDTGGGVEWLLPLSDDIPLVLSAGGFVRNGDGRSWAPGVVGGAWVGSRSFNFHAWYGMAAGLFVQTRWVPESPSNVAALAGVQVDLEMLALPWIFLFDAIKGGP